MTDVILMFPSNSGTMIATKALRDSGVAARMIPTPPSVQSASNLCLSIDHALEAAALAALKAANVGVSTVVR
ncbi:MAG TPA: putative Se/S carrier-like protein [Xanthomonadales bacterium]|nr:putative Se/S carrier-like protein [Xanthomonadales bacterium]